MIWNLIKGATVIGIISSGSVFGAKYFFGNHINNKKNEVKKTLKIEENRREGYKREKEGEENADIHAKKQFNCLLNTLKKSNWHLAKDIAKGFEKYDISSEACSGSCNECN